jgi:hypothetical protein
MSEESRTAIVLLPVLLIYLLPTIIATIRQRPNVAGIAAINVFAGWTVIGWVLPLVWALKREGHAPQPAPAAEPGRPEWRSPVEYIPMSQRAAEPEPGRMEITAPARSRFADAEEEARAVHQAARRPGGEAWS